MYVAGSAEFDQPLEGPPNQGSPCLPLFMTRESLEGSLCMFWKPEGGNPFGWLFAPKLLYALASFEYALL